jgi:hypothetical protein
VTGGAAAPRLPTVSVVIPTQGRSDLLVELVRRVLADPATTELVVANDGEALRTHEILAAAHPDPRVKVVHDPGGKAVSHREGWARNMGVRAASSTVVLALDDDLLPEPNLVSGHAAWHSTADDLVVLGYMPVSSRLARSSAATRLVSQGYEQACAKMEHEPSSILLGLWGGNFSVRRQHWLQVLDGSSFGGVYHEDRELGLLFHRAGLQGVFDRRLRAAHQHTGSVGQCMANARLSAKAQVRLHRLFPELAKDPRRGNPGAPRRMVDVWDAICSLRITSQVTTAMARAAVEVGLRLRLNSLEWVGMRVLRRVAFEQGLREAAADVDASGSKSSPVA